MDIWVDSASLEPSSDLDHLLSFAAHPQHRFVTTKPVPGGLTAELIIGNGQAGAKIEKPSGTRWVGGGPVKTWEALTDRWAPTLDPVQRDRVLTSMLLATVADKRTADLFVTGTVDVRTKVRGANGVTVEEALAVIGLFLRSQDDFVVSVAPGFAYNRGLFYSLLARELLPSWGPSWRGLVPHGAGGMPTFLNGLGHALIVRADYALRARDRAQFELKLPQNNDTADEFLFALDGLVVALDACFDILARVLNRHYGLSNKDASARWRSKQWLDKLLAKAPTLADVITDRTLLQDVLILLGGLRRSLHGVPLQTIANSAGPGVREIENLFVVPPEDQSDIAEALDRRGGRDTWGVRPGIDGLLFVDPNCFVEVISRSAFEAIEYVVSAVGGPNAAHDEPGGWGDTPEVRHRMRALSGTLEWNATGAT